MNTSLFHCIYASRAAADFQASDIPALLRKAREDNFRSDITGMLLYIDGSFFRVLEGEEQAVSRSFEKIRLDSRHKRVTQIIREPIAQRSFTEWSMGFSAIGLQEAGELTGENDFFTDAACLERLDSGRAKKLLSVFKGGGWRMDQTGVFNSSGRIA
jgi:hypothetical protein